MERTSERAQAGRDGLTPAALAGPGEVRYPGANGAIGGGQRGLVLAGVMCCVFLAAMESTVVATAMPTVVASLGGIRIYSWVFSAYLLTSTVTMPIWGRFSDQLGRRRTYLAGLTLFLIGSALAGLSQSMGQLILFRAVQGLGAGSLITLGITIIGELYELEKRAKVQGYFSSVWGLASLIGPLLGGLMVDRVGWRWVFYVNVPLGLLALVAIAAGLRDEARPVRKVAIDYTGMVLFTTAVTALLVALLEAGKGDSWFRVPGLLAAAAACTVLFIFVERHTPGAMVPLRLFRRPMVRAASATGFLAGMAMFGAVTFIPLFVQAVAGASATEAGFVLTPFVLGWVACSILGARLVLRVGYRSVVIVGMLILLLGFLRFSAWDASLTPLGAARDIALAGIGMGLVFVPMLIAVQSAVPRALLGAATSMTTFFRTIGGAVGVGVMGAVMALRLQIELDAILRGASPALRESLRAVVEHPDLVVNPMTRGSLSPEVLTQMRPALAEAIGGVFVVGLFICVAALLAAFLVPGGQARDLAETESTPPPA